MTTDFAKLRQLSQQLVKNITVKDFMPTACISYDAVSRLSVATDLQALTDTLDSEGADSRQEHKLIVWIEGCLHNPNGLKDDSQRTRLANKLLDWVLKAVTPPSFFNARSFLDPDAPLEPSSEQVLRFRLKALAGLRLISKLCSLIPDTLNDANLEFSSHVAAFTDGHDPWTHPECVRLASDLLQAQQIALAAREPKLADEVRPRLLKEVVRPLFSKSSNPTITAQGRKAISQPVVRQFDSTPEYVEKPWKFRRAWVTTVFGWCVNGLEGNAIQENWPLLIPPLLAMIDDEGTEFKIKGCRILRFFLAKMDPALLQRTGLGEVFEQALIPLLTYLPTLTPEPECLQLLGEAYPTLTTLATKRFSTQKERGKVLQSLDKILREGILTGCSYAGDYPDIVTLLMRRLERLITLMGIQGVKHLKTIIPLLVENLCNPFITAHPPLLLASIDVLQNAILNWWPRIPQYKGEVVQAITLCWLRVCSDSTQDESRVNMRISLRQTFALLRATLNDDEEALAGIDDVLSCDSALAGLSEPVEDEDGSPD